MSKDPLSILFETYWSSSGWRAPAFTPADDLRIAVEAGVMFEPRHIDHDRGVQWAIESVLSVSKERVVAAFVSSVGSRRLDNRSAFGSFVIGRHLKPHRNWPRIFDNCGVCGLWGKPDEPEDISVLNFERHKWGGVRHSNPIYIGFDLELFRKSTECEPTRQDRLLLSEIIDRIRSLPSQSRPREAEKELAKCLKSNKAEREILLDMLGYAGILEPNDHPSYFQRFVPVNQRRERPVNKIDWQYPISWWTGADGVNERAVDYWFGKWID